MMHAAPLNTRWRPQPSASAPPIYRHWLSRPGALTAGLRQLGQVDLYVLHEYPSGISSDEGAGLGLHRHTPVWIREVRMQINGIDCVVARSLTPLLASHSVWQGMRRLRQRPLADLLYHDRHIQRSAFACCRLTCRLPLYRTARAVLPSVTWHATLKPELWARRSIFWRHHQPLLVAECFLPDFWRMLQARTPTR